MLAKRKSSKCNFINQLARILIITTKQPSGNPRMRKSADALAEDGHVVHVLYAYNADWAAAADQSILQSAKWTYELIGGDPHTERLHYQWTRLWRKAFEMLGHVERNDVQGGFIYAERDQLESRSRHRSQSGCARTFASASQKNCRSRPCLTQRIFIAESLLDKCCLGACPLDSRTRPLSELSFITAHRP